MRVEKLELPIYISRNENHDKEAILDAIESVYGTDNRIKNERDDVSNTNFHLHQSEYEGSQKYFELIWDHVSKHVEHYKNIHTDMILPGGYVEHHWFNQYRTGDRQGWHTHPTISTSNIYYVDLPDKKYSTEFYLGGKAVQLDVQEGDLVTFPSYLMHRAPLIRDRDVTKTIISFGFSLRQSEL